jgi:hypothetical protein
MRSPCLPCKPQGSPKKIKVDLLLANLALEVGDLPTGRGQLVERLARRARPPSQDRRL